ncbi:MAG: hypothetical protein J7L62_02955 [Candidatus Aminicenantes bacterium]|nr:hypothetical protein [Candidatus Aminicenantes bacterium]
MRLYEIVLALFIVFIVATLYPLKRVYSSSRKDAYKVASFVRSCAVFSLGNEWCRVIIVGKNVELNCSGGFLRKTELDSKVSEGVLRCSEGVIENPVTIKIEQFLVKVGRRGVNIEVNHEM